MATMANQIQALAMSAMIPIFVIAHSISLPKHSFSTNLILSTQPLSLNYVILASDIPYKSLIYSTQMNLLSSNSYNWVGGRYYTEISIELPNLMLIGSTWAWGKYLPLGGHQPIIKCW